MSGKATYDSNVARADAQIAAQRGLTRQDEILSPAVSVNLVKSFGPDSVFLLGSAGYDFYVRNHILNRERFDLHPGASAKLGPCQGTLIGGYVSHQSDLLDLTRAVTSNVEQDESVAVSATCPRPIGFAPIASLTQTWSSNSNPIVSGSDYRRFDATGGLSYTRPVFGQLSVYEEYEQTVFPNRSIAAGFPPSAGGYNLYSEVLRYDRKLGARIEGTVLVGYTTLQTFGTNTTPFNSVTYSADITYRLSGRISAHFHLDRDVKPTNAVDATFAVQTDYIAEASYLVSSRSTFTIGGSSDTADNKGSALIGGVDITHSTLNALYGSLSLNIGPHLGLAFDARTEDRSSNLAAFNYSDARISVTANSKF